MSTLPGDGVGGSPGGADGPVSAGGAGGIGGAVASARGGGPVADLLASVERVGVGPLVVRAVALGSGFAAVLLAVPAPLRGSGIWVLGALLALGAAIGVATPWVSGLEFIAVIMWFLGTTIYPYHTSVAQALGLAVALYLHHSACTLAATLPIDAVVAPQLLRRWGLRTGGVLGVSLLLGVLVLVLPSLLGRSHLVLLPVLGLAALLVAGYVLIRLTRHP